MNCHTSMTAHPEVPPPDARWFNPALRSTLICSNDWVIFDGRCFKDVSQEDWVRFS